LQLKKDLYVKRKQDVKIFLFLNFQNQFKMKKKSRHLPADSDANPKNEDLQYENQEEFDDPARKQLNDDAKNLQNARLKQESDSQLKHESMIPPEKKKQPEKWDKVDRKLPNLKK